MLLLLIRGNYKLRYLVSSTGINIILIFCKKKLLSVLEVKMKDTHNQRQMVPSHISGYFRVRTDNTPKNVRTAYFYFIQTFQYVSLSRI